MKALFGIFFGLVFASSFCCFTVLFGIKIGLSENVAVGSVIAGVILIHAALSEQARKKKSGDHEDGDNQKAKPGET